MFFDSPEEIERIAKRTGTAIFVMPERIDFARQHTMIANKLARGQNNDYD